MRILFLSNFYPPLRSGGYEQWCQEVANGLAQRGHEIAILTSRYRRESAPAGERNVFRRLHLELSGDLLYYQPLDFLRHHRRRQRDNRAIVNEVARQFNPDVIFVWGMWAMSRAVPAAAEALLPDGVVYYLSDYWLADQDMHTTYWNRPVNHRLMRWPKALLGRWAHQILAAEKPAPLDLRQAICVSQAVRDILVGAGLPLQEALVIHGGTDPGRFRQLPARSGDPDRPLQLLYVGQLVPHKGVHTAIAALQYLVNRLDVRDVRLTIAGSGHPDYESGLREAVERANLGPYVRFAGQLNRADIPAAMARADALVFPSIYEEPFARTTQEAMLAGLAVVGTTTGGSGELLQHEVNALTFPPEEEQALAEQIARLAVDRRLCRRLAAAGRQRVLADFTLDRMVDQIESYLLSLTRGRVSTPNLVIP